MDFSMSESCGKCVPCRVGTVHLHRLLDKIVKGSGHARDIAQIEELSELLQECSLCGLGQAAPNPVLSTLRYFRNEYNDKLLPDSVWEEETVS
jgi:bidirectional [NiFe] hydrogenase diaphorase subunit